MAAHQFFDTLLPEEIDICTTLDKEPFWSIVGVEFPPNRIDVPACETPINAYLRAALLSTT